MNCEEVFNSMVSNTKAYLEKNGLKTMVLGLSGGIDSTLSAFICHEVAKQSDGKLKLIGVSLPSNTNEEQENQIAKKIGIELCDDFILHPIEDDYQNIKDSFDRSCYEASLPYMNNLQKGNIKARIRMMYLYNIASLVNGVVIDTDNLTEFMLGFKTRHGDEGDINVGISRLWKHEIYELSKWIEENYTGFTSNRLRLALKYSITITPTDGNGVQAGGDLVQIAPGYTYEAVDEVLDTINCYRSTDAFEAEMNKLKDKYDEKMVDGIYERFQRNAFKRKPYPITVTPF